MGALEGALAGSDTGLVLHQEQFTLVPRTFAEAMEFAKLIAASDFCPKDCKGKPGNVLVAIQHGHEVGLQPMQAIQNIAVINGRPSLWGDAMLALCMTHPRWGGHLEKSVEQMEEIRRRVEEEGYVPTELERVALVHTDYDNKPAQVCVVARVGNDPKFQQFGVREATKAKLINKAGTWTEYPERMMQMRARSWALRDQFPDKLKGLVAREEALDTPPPETKVVKAVSVRDVTEPRPKNGDAPAVPSKTDQLKAEMKSRKLAEAKEQAAAQPGVEDELTLPSFIAALAMADTKAELEALWPHGQRLPPADWPAVKEAWKARMVEIRKQAKQAPPEPERQPGEDEAPWTKHMPPDTGDVQEEQEE